MPASKKTSAEIAPPRRKRGAPFGNTNALKHGFYSRHFSNSETADLESSSFPGLADEVSMLRIVLRRLFAHASTTPDEKFMISDFKSLSVISIHLAQLLHKHRTLTGEENPVIQLISNSINEVFDEQFQPKKRRKPS